MSGPHELPPETEEQKAERLRRQDEVERLQRRKTLGAEGKLWTVQANYREGNIPRLVENRNFTWSEVMDFRQLVFTHGLLMQVDPGKWRIISPYDITDVYLIRQLKFYEQ
jgi:hypothetical protein